MRENFLNWEEDHFDAGYSGDLELDQTVDVNAPNPMPLMARQKLELYWERKRLERNLYDVFNDDNHIQTRL